MTEEDRAILAFEETQQMDQAHHDEAVRQRFGLSRTQYAQRLNELARRRDLIEAFPVLVHRLERQMAARLARRERRALRQFAA